MYQEPEPMREIHEIRECMHEEMKNMNAKEKIEYIHKCAEDARDKYGLNLRKVSYEDKIN